MGITLKEIARIANVHRSTVDKVLHNREGVSDDVRNRIKQIIQETGYTPNTLGQALQRKHGVIRIAAVLLKVDALSIIQEGIRQAIAHFEGFDIDIQYYYIDYFDDALQLEILEKLIEDKIDGVVLSPINVEPIRAVIDKMAEAQIPVVTTMNFDIPDSKRLCFVGQDAFRGGMIAASLVDKLLSAKGKVLLITATEQGAHISYSELRRDGFEYMLKKEYVGIHIAGYVVGFDDPVVIEQEVSAVLRGGDWPNCIFITGGGVAVVGKLLDKYDPEHRIKVVCFERYAQILALIQTGTIDFTIDSGMKNQGFLSIEVLIDYLVYKKEPLCDKIYTQNEILVKGSLFEVGRL